MQLSIIIPSLRPENIKQIRNFFKENISIDYELIVISPNEIDDCVFVKEDKIEGIYKAVEKGMKVAKGEYILHMPDDSCPFKGAVEELIKFTENRKGLFMAAFMCCTGAFVYEQGGYYGKYFSGFPFMRRKDIDKMGILMDTYYSSFYGDPDLSLRVWDKGGKVEVCPSAWMHIASKVDDVTSESMRKYEEDDKKKFINRWSEKLGEFIDYHHCTNQLTGVPPF